ncbi:hypothetical protein TraAM80_04236 [Trypanosoma rangeli]|uniref:ADP-ribosylglycohydrolase n=1 Tax=Trypanosoma rangeli TaxID=5698 RepID=A0A3R7KDQ9_TRYRA|nr:uncharacterized protein TraAM80_04236 [Trypanosoma rangeli]RNF05990.1 hypothetical protein TraAM80_04236 [Trypanosoma rangeli]|eukprot:RNF05990.1 hypothetical protein TraAM80_04236 [Trypanosoma rangeli]
MVATLHHNFVPRTTNFYENSLKQLSDIQQKQAGLLIGAVVADAAARGLEGFSAEEIAEFEKRQAALHGGSDGEESLVFALAGPPHRSSSPPLTGALRHHSYTCLLVQQLLRVMAAARGEFPVSYVKDRWVSVAHAHPQCFAAEHASLLNVLGVVLSLPVIYPWTDDATLRAYATPFIDFLTEPPEGGVAAATTRSAVLAYTFSALGVALRCLQSNPDPYRNAAIMAVPGTADLFPDDVVSFAPRRAQNELLSQLVDASAAGLDATPLSACGSSSRDGCARAAGHSAALSPARPLVEDIRVSREALIVARRARSFADGVRAAIRLGAPVCQRSLLVGGLLGARLGVRRIPPSWLSATHDHSPLATMAIEVAQWSWNPPHH